MFNEYTDMLTVEELCEIMNIGKNSAYRLLKNHEIKAFQQGRSWKIPKYSVEEFIRLKSK